MCLDPRAPLSLKPCEICKNVRASGIFSVVTKVFGREVAVEMKLCAQCGLYKIARRIRMFVPKGAEGKDAKPMFYRDVVSVNLIQTI